MVEWYLFLPQVRLSAGDITERARHAEASGFDGIAFIDHLEAPGLPGESIWEAMAIATWVAAKTERLRIGHLVLCDAFRHPAVLAKQAVTLSDASEGRFDLGLGSGSWPAEFTRFDVGQQDPVARVRQLDRHLALIRQYWGDQVGEATEEAGEEITPEELLPLLEAEATAEPADRQILDAYSPVPTALEPALRLPVLHTHATVAHHAADLADASSSPDLSTGPLQPLTCEPMEEV